jgi:arsenic resistance protein ArsH
LVDPLALANIAPAAFEKPSAERLQLLQLRRRPRVLLFYGSLRQRSYSRFLTLEAARLLEAFGADTRIFDPSGLPLPDDVPEGHLKVEEPRGLSAWSEAQVWCLPERHGAMTGIIKAQLDWIALSIGAVRPTQGKTLAVMQVSGGSQSFNAVNQLRILGRWMRMITIPNQASVAKAHEQFDEAGANAAFALLRSPGRRNGGVDEVYLFDARSVRLPHEPLFRAQGRRRKPFRAKRD